MILHKNSLFLHGTCRLQKGPTGSTGGRWAEPDTEGKAAPTSESPSRSLRPEPLIPHKKLGISWGVSNIAELEWGVRENPSKKRFAEQVIMMCSNQNERVGLFMRAKLCNVSSVKDRIT